MKKRISALMLSVVLCLGMLSTTAFAAKVDVKGEPDASATIFTLSGVSGKRLCALWDSAERNQILLLFYTDSDGSASISVPTLAAGKSYYIGIEGGDQALYIFPDAANPDRKQHTITLDPNGGSTTGGVSVLQTDWDGKLLSLPAAARANYVFNGWYTAADGGTQITVDTKFDGDTAIYAHWLSDGSDRSIEYHVEDLILCDVNTNETLSSIPSEDFLAKVTVTNLSSAEADTVLLITYDKDGKMLDIHRLAVNSQTGQTVTLETRVQNSGGKTGKIKALVLPARAFPVPLANAMERT